MVRLELTLVISDILSIPSDSSDYRKIYRHALVFNGAVSSQLVTVSIRDDMVVENQFERFFINLRKYYWYDSAVILNGSTASVTIEDDDSELSLQYMKHCTFTRMSIYHNFFFYLSGYNWIQWNLFSA